MPNRYRFMMADEVRTLAYKKAISECVKKDDVVLDLGAGLGILSLFACQAKAKKVYALEQQEDVIRYAKSVASRNGFRDKIVFINGLSSHANIPELVDVIVSETLATMGVEENIVESLYDAKKRFLKKDGIIIPSCIELYVAPVSSEDIFHSTLGWWNEDVFGFDFSSLRNVVTHSRFIRSINAKALLTFPEKIAFFDFTKSSPLFNGKTTFNITKKSTCHGIAGWFKVKLSPRIDLTNSPIDKPTHWQQVFFPVKEPLSLKRGDKIKVKISNKLFHQRMVWNWHVEANGKKFQGSTLKRLPQKQDILNINFFSHRPNLSQQADIDKTILNLCNGKKTVEQIAEELRKLFPEKFKTIFLASEKVARVLLAYNMK